MGAARTQRCAGELTNEVVVYTPTNAIIITNLQLFVTSNLTLLTAQSLTNNDAALQALYPDLVIAPNTTVPSFTNIITTNLGAYYTNYVYDPVGTPPHLAYVTNRTTNVMFIYRRGFANVVTNSYSTRSWVTVVDTNIYFPPTAPAGYSITNTTTTTMLTNMVVGDYYIVPTNLACGFHYLSNVLSTLVGVTNTLVITNTPTNGVGGAAYLLSRTYINWYTNHFLAYRVIGNCFWAPRVLSAARGRRRHQRSWLGSRYKPGSSRSSRPQAEGSCAVAQELGGAA